MKLLMTFAYLLCFVLNTSTMVAVSPMENSGFSVIENVGREPIFDVRQNLTHYFAKGFRFPKSRLPKAAPKPKGQPKSSGKDSPKGSHDKNQRESNREKHENADARRQKEQKKAEEKREQNKKNK